MRISVQAGINLNRVGTPAKVKCPSFLFPLKARFRTVRPVQKATVCGAVGATVTKSKSHAQRQKPNYKQNTRTAGTLDV